MLHFEVPCHWWRGNVLHSIMRLPSLIRLPVLCSVQHGRGERLQRNAVNTLRFVGAILARPALRSNAVALRTFLPPLLRPILELLPGSGCISSPCSDVRPTRKLWFYCTRQSVCSRI